MSETKNPGEKTLSVAPTKTLTLKPRVEQGVVRQSFSHGRTKAVVVEKVKSRVPGKAATAAPVVEARPAPKRPSAPPPPSKPAPAPPPAAPATVPSQTPAAPATKPSGVVL